jgi:DNA repair exonuclease SbcCD ATPase subunit
MKTAFALILLAIAAPVTHATSSPITKVVEMIGELQAKIIGEGEASQKVYEEFAEWCEDQSKQLTFEIKTGKAEVKELQATIAESEALIGSLTVEVEKLSGEIKVDEADLKAAVEIREKEAEAFAATEKELVDIIDTLQRAVGILEREMSKHGASMMQIQGATSLADALKVMISASMIGSADGAKLAALVQTKGEDSESGAPAAATYEGQSGGIIEVLQDMNEKAEAQLEEARGKETADLNAFAMLKQSLEDEIKFANKEMSEAKASMAASGEKKAAAEGDLGITSKALETDITALADLHQDCMTKATEFEAETKSRGEELAAIAKAKQIIEEMTSGAADQSYSFVQVSSKITSKVGLAQFEAARFVRDLAHKHHSTQLAQLAARITSVANSNSKDIFGKVKDLVRDMIEKLEAEAEADATEKAFCDKELGETNAKKEEKETKVEKLSTKIDQMSARSAQLKEEVAALETALSDIASSQAEMDKLRSEENALYTKSKAEMEQGVEGVKMALKVLKDYYAKADKAHSSSDGASSGIIGLLEVCEADFSKGLAELVSTEEQAVSAYETESKENEIEKSTKEQDVKYKTKESTDLDKSAAEASNDKTGVQTELDAVLKYLKGIEDRCIAKAETHEERAARFKSEIAGLKQALEILNNEAALVQTKSRHLRAVGKH